jgi:hypothetical protein
VAAFVLDAGALIAIDRGARDRIADLRKIEHSAHDLISHPFVVAQVWRSGKQANLARFLKGVAIRTIDDPMGRRCGELLGKAGTDDPIDAAVVLLAENGDRILTSDPDDIRRLVTASGKDVRVVAT